MGDSDRAERERSQLLAREQQARHEAERSRAEAEAEREKLANEVVERNRVEAELRESEARLRLTLQSGEIGAWDLDLQTLTATRSLEHDKIFGYREMLPEWSYGKFLGVHVHPDDRAHVDATFQRVMDTYDDWDFECRIIRVDGNVRWIWARGSVHRNHAGEPVRLLGLVKDITDRKQVEQRLGTARDQLELRVQERTAELESLNAELESFNYSVSHDLRAPLRGIDGFSQALLEDHWEELNDNARQHLLRIRSGAERMGQLIDDLLDLSRLSSRPIRRRPIDLTRMAEEIVAELRTRDPERRVEVEVQAAATADADFGLVRTILENLLGNAWKFTRKREDARIEFGMLSSTEVPVLFVRDNGAGFDNKYAGKLFAAFQRLHSAEEFSGTGIGLAIVQRIVRRHGGRVWAEGEPDKGASFYFTLGRPEGDGNYQDISMR
ncbi:MAG: ATP-binding protein [Trueperaceae bacterium]